MSENCFIKKIQLRNFLSYGPEAQELEMRSLNVIVGANGSGKSNLFDAISILKATPASIAFPIRKGGGVTDWLWAGAAGNINETIASLVFEFGGITKKYGDTNILYQLDFTARRNRFEIVAEKLTNARSLKGTKTPYIFYSHDQEKTIINVSDSQRHLQREDVDPELSVFAQRKDMLNYPEITLLGRQFEKIRIYREWHCGIDWAVRQSQPTDGEASYLLEDGSNLALVLSRLLSNASVETRRAIKDEVKNVYEGIDDILVRIESGRAIPVIEEHSLPYHVPANRLSDGTLRYLCLMAILLNPESSPLICIDEPEMGMHPDMINSLAKMLINASERTQLIVNTHSPLLLDALSDVYESVVVCEKHNGCSCLHRLSSDDWSRSEGMSLGKAWMSGSLGGVRW